MMAALLQYLLDGEQEIKTSFCDERCYMTLHVSRLQER
jgi:hypothetical protein